MANHLEREKGIFSEEDKANTKDLREAKGFVRRDNKEFNARRRDIRKRGGFRGRGFFNYKRGGFSPSLMYRINNWASNWTNKNVGVPAQQVAAKYNRSGAPLACFKYGSEGTPPPGWKKTILKHFVWTNTF